MSRLPVISGDDFVRTVRGIGYVWDRTEGSHMILRRADGRSLSVPRHSETHEIIGQSVDAADNYCCRHLTSACTQGTSGNP